MISILLTSLIDRACANSPFWSLFLRGLGAATLRAASSPSVSTVRVIVYMHVCKDVAGGPRTFIQRAKAWQALRARSGTYGVLPGIPRIPPSGNTSGPWWPRSSGLTRARFEDCTGPVHALNTIAEHVRVHQTISNHMGSNELASNPRLLKYKGSNSVSLALVAEKKSLKPAVGLGAMGSATALSKADIAASRARTGLRVDCPAHC